MPFNISDFQSQIAYRGFLKPNKFQVTFNLPSAFSRASDPDFAVYNSIVRDFGMWCDATSLPGVILQTSTLRRYGYGQTEKRPIVPNFNDVQLRIITDGAGMTWELFRRWMQKVNNSNSSQGMSTAAGIATTETAAGVPLQTYESSYPTDYTTRVVVSVYNDIGIEVKRITLNECYPSALSDIALGWDHNNDLARFTVNLAIQDWNIEVLT